MAGYADSIFLLMPKRGTNLPPNYEPNIYRPKKKYHFKELKMNPPSQTKYGTLVRERLVEACRTTQTCKSLVPIVFASASNIAKYCRSLELEGWIKITRHKKAPMEFLTIIDEPYCKLKEMPVPHARVIRMEALDKIEGYYVRPLRKQEHSGIGSSFNMMEVA